MSASAPMLQVTVHYALPHQHWCRQVLLAAGATVDDALAASGFYAAHPQWQMDHGAGVDGKVVALDTPLSPGDRVEVYRPLTFDPMVSRRRRAAHRARQAAGEAAPRRRSAAHPRIPH